MLDDLELTPDTRVLVDTTVILAALVPSQRDHTVADALLQRISSHGATVVVSRLTDLELPQAASYIAGQQASGDRRAGLRDGRVRRRAARIAHAVGDGWSTYLSTARWTRVEIDVIIVSVADLMFRTGLRSYDAAIAASAISTRCDAIATLDADFGRLAPADVPYIATTPTKARRVRTLRAAARPI